MSYARVEGKLLTPRSGALLTLMALGIVAAIYRFSEGLGATTSLTDQFPWGIWVAFDVLCGVAVTAGGFTAAAIVYLFFKEKLYGLVRPALLTAFLGYVFVIIGVLFDLGLPWMVWSPIINWPRSSPMFVVAWCDMLVVAVLALLFMPAVFERFHLNKLYDLWLKAVPLFVVGATTFFSFIMSHSIYWGMATFAIFTALAVIIPAMYQRKTGLPILLIICGILFSVSHQSALGSLFLLMQDRLDHLWWTPMLPVNFYLSAIPAGMAMVIFESTLSAKSFRLPVESKALKTISKVLYYTLWIYLAVRLLDLLVRGQLGGILGPKGPLFVVEMLVGVIIPIILFSLNRTRTETWPRFAGAALIIVGLIVNRFNIVMFAMTRPGSGVYIPSIEELLITGGIVSGFMFFYNVVVRLFPVMEKPALHEELLVRTEAKEA